MTFLQAQQWPSHCCASHGDTAFPTAFGHLHAGRCSSLVGRPVVRRASQANRHALHIPEHARQGLVLTLIPPASGALLQARLQSRSCFSNDLTAQQRFRPLSNVSTG
jgi:hypothetical protein